MTTNAKPTPAAPLDLDALEAKLAYLSGPSSMFDDRTISRVLDVVHAAPALIARVREAEADLAARDATIAELRAALFKAIAIAESLIDGLYTRPQAMKPPLARLRDAHLADAATRTDED